MKIVVLAGGISTEREISIVSGTQVCKALRSRGHQAILVDVYFGREDADPMQAFTDEYDVDAAAAYARSFDGQVEKSIQEGKAFFGTNVIALCQAADVVFLALHGENGENGKVQAAFDLLGIRYTGSGYLGSAIAMDKGLSKQLFWQNEVPTPAGFILRKGEDISLEAHGMTLPCVVKPCCGGSSVGVTIPKTQEEYEAAVADAFSYEIMCQGQEKLQYYIDDYTRRSDSLSKKEQDTMKDMHIVQEMYARGYEFLPIDIYRAKAAKFSIIDGKLMPPFSSIDGMGEKAAEAVEEAAKDGPYLSKDDFRNRTKASKAVVDYMADLGLLGDLPESNQLSLFDL